MTTTTSETALVLKTDIKGRVLTPAKEREALLDAFEQSGMSGAAFARLHGIRYTTFAHWRRMRRKLREAKEDRQPAFQEVAIQAEKPSAHALTIELPGGGRVRLERADQLPMAKALLHYLDS
jgi:DNA-binding transcriptional regulator/RsmH inhibitor MraZ